MKVKIKRIDKELALPEYQTQGSVAFDILARETMTIQPQSLGFIPGNVIIQTPEGYMLVLASRSSGPKKKGLMTPHGIGIIDQDYCGNEDELKVQVYNFTQEPVTVERGERIAQATFARIDRCMWEEVDDMGDNSRGGFGSTGSR